MPASAPLIRTATEADAAAISDVVLRALRETNAQDYATAVIEAVAANFSPAAVADRMRHRLVLVALADGQVVGTASLEAGSVRSVFVRPDHHRRGIGAALMAAIEARATTRGLSRLTVPSSVTAEGFYQRLGYRAVRDAFHGTERTIVMEKPLDGRTTPLSTDPE